MRIFTFILFLALCVAPEARADSKTEDDLFIEGASNKWREVKDYTCILIKQERYKGKLGAQETMFMKFRKEPYSVYMKWIEPPHKGAELIFNKGRNDNKIIYHTGGILNVINLRFDPYGWMAMKGSRHSIDKVGLGNMIGKIVEAAGRARKNKEGELIDLGDQTIEGIRVHCHKVILPPPKVAAEPTEASSNKYFAVMSVVGWDSKTRFPVVIINYTGDQEILEKYIHKDLKLNPGLTDMDFDPHNKEYGF